MTTLSTFPIDDVTLSAIEHAMGGSFTVDSDGTHRLVGADYSMSDLFNFLSGYDPDAVVMISEEVAEYVGGPIYNRDDIIRALIAEVRRLRAEVGL